MAKGSKWYAVRVGRQTGVFTTWEECSSQVTGFSGAQFKSFTDKNAAVDFVKASAENYAKKSEQRSIEKTSSGWTPALSALKQSGAPRAGVKRRSPEPPSSSSTSSEAWEAKAVKRTVPAEREIARDKFLEVYTDGACKGNADVVNRNPPAGWGYLVRAVDTTCEEAKDTILHEEYGPVITYRKHPDFLGAEVSSNNTGELSAIGRALRFLCSADMAPHWKHAEVVIRFDSEYAAKSVEGIYNGQKNRELIDNCRKLLLTARTRRGNSIEFVHVKGHSNDKFNDRADYLANQGAAAAASLARNFSSTTEREQKSECPK